MKSAKILCAVVLLALATVIAPSAWAIHVDSSTFAAVAYSASTGQFRYSYGYRSRASAEQAALQDLSAQDGRIVCWVNRGFCALALGDDKSCWGTGWTYGDGASTTEAKDRALEQCGNRTTGARIVLCLVSDGQYVFERKPIWRELPAGAAAGQPVQPAHAQQPYSMTPAAAPRLNPDPMEFLAERPR